MKRISMKVANGFLSVFCLLLLWNSSTLAQNNPPQTQTTEDESPQEPLRIRLMANPETLDWNRASTSHETHIMMNIMEGLLEHDDKLQLQPALAESWSLSSDRLTYTFKIKQGLLWSDGKELLAEHFYHSWIRTLEPSTGSNNASLFFPIRNAKAFHAGTIKDSSQVGITVLDKYRLQVDLMKPVPHFAQIFTYWSSFPIRKDLMRTWGSLWTQPEKLAVIGPYRITKYEKGQFIAFRPNRKYWRLHPNMPQHVVATIEADDQKASDLYFSGKLDLLLSVKTADLLRHKSQNKIKTQILKFPYLATYYLGFNTRSGPLKDVHLRRALTTALDRRQIPGVLKGGESAAKGWIPPQVPGHGLNNGLSNSIYEARGALMRAGYSEGKGLGKLSLLVERLNGADEIAQWIGDTLKRNLNLDLFFRIESPDVYKQVRSSGGADLFLGHWGADYVDPANFYDVFISGSSANHTGWSNKIYDEYVEKARGLEKMSERLVWYQKAEKILTDEDIVIVPLFYPLNILLVSHHVKGVKISPLNYFFFKDVQLLKTP